MALYTVQIDTYDIVWHCMFFSFMLLLSVLFLNEFVFPYLSYLAITRPKNELRYNKTQWTLHKYAVDNTIWNKFGTYTEIVCIT